MARTKHYKTIPGIEKTETPEGYVFHFQPPGAKQRNPHEVSIVQQTKTPEWIEYVFRLPGGELEAVRKYANPANKRQRAETKRAAKYLLRAKKEVQEPVPKTKQLEAQFQREERETTRKRIEAENAYHERLRKKGLLS
jgi:hypothetical protein